MDDYRIFHLGSEKLFACGPASTGLALSLFPRYTWRKRAAVALVRGSFLLGALRAISAGFAWRDPYNTSFNLKPCTDALRSVVGDGVDLVFFFQKQAERRRVYVHAHRGGTPIAFAKISHGETRARGLGSEAALLQKLESLPVLFRSPRLLRLMDGSGYEMLVTEALPRDDVSTPTEAELSRALESLHCTHRWAPSSDILAEPWWQRFESRAGRTPAGNASRIEILDLLSRLGGAHCGLAQGDPGPHNALRHAGRTWIYDWEDASCLAPRLTDQIGLRLAFSGRHRQRMFSALLDPSTESTARLDVLLAIAYRASIGVADAMPTAESK